MVLQNNPKYSLRSPVPICINCSCLGVEGRGEQLLIKEKRKFVATYDAKLLGITRMLILRKQG